MSMSPSKWMQTLKKNFGHLGVTIQALPNGKHWKIILPNGKILRTAGTPSDPFALKRVKASVNKFMKEAA